MSPARQRRPQGTGSVFQRKSDGLWVARIDAGWDAHGNRKRPQRTSKTKSGAHLALKELQRQHATGNLPDAGSGARATVKAWADAWLPAHAREVRPNVHVTDSGHVTKWIVPTIGQRRLTDLNPGDVRKIHLAVTSAGLSPTTARNVHRTLMKMLRDARLDGHPIPERIFDVKAPRPAASTRDQIPVEHVLALLKIIGERDDASRWLFRILYPVRQGEALGLTWDSLDLPNGSVTFDWQLDQYPADVTPPRWLRSRHLTGPMWLVEPKTSSRNATLPLLPFVAASLEAWQATSPANDYGLVWTHNGQPIRDHIDRKQWHAIQQQAKVAHPDGRPWHLHETRHTAASIMIDLGEDPRTIAAILGQTRLVESYVHVDRTSITRAMGRFAEVLGLGN